MGIWTLYVLYDPSVSGNHAVAIYCIKWDAFDQYALGNYTASVVFDLSSVYYVQFL